MAAAAHNPAFARKVGIPQKVAKDFNQADQGTAMLSNAMKGYAKGGDVRQASYATGGPVLGRTVSFAKIKDEFREDTPTDTDDKNYGKSGPGAGKGQTKPPAVASKSSKDKVSG
jgi:hypothetical protein